MQPTPAQGSVLEQHPAFIGAEGGRHTSGLPASLVPASVPLSIPASFGANVASESPSSRTSLEPSRMMAPAASGKYRSGTGSHPADPDAITSVAAQAMTPGHAAPEITSAR